jgi:hypothetical protein
VLAHRMVPTPEAQFQGVGSSEALAQVLAAVAVPGGH